MTPGAEPKRDVAPRTPLNVLIVEDSREDTELLLLELERGGYTPNFLRVDTPEAMSNALASGSWDVVLSDYSMPRFSVPDALRLMRERGLDLPFVIVSATIVDEQAVEAMRAGAHDFVMKHNLTRLIPAIRRETREAEVRRERRTLEERLRQAQKLESLGLLAGGVAHDFNNLLTGILGNASLVLETWSAPAEARECLEDVVRASERAADLTRQLLAYAGKGRFVIEPVHLSALVRDIHDLVHTSVSRKVNLILDLQSDLPFIEADASQIRQLVMNLVLNASEAIGDHAGTILISTGVRELEPAVIRQRYPGADVDPGEYCYLEVDDTGCGMEDETRAQIFDPFFTTKFTGRGLGLAAALGIVRGHKGVIRVESAPGKGSHFEVLLPVAAAHIRIGPAAATRGGSPRSLAGSGIVLVVDDETIVRRAARAALEHYGYSVLEAEDGQQAVEIVRRDRDGIALVLLDLTMPVVSGDEAFRMLKQIRPDLRVIVTSGYEELYAYERFDAKAGAAFIKKPYTATKLAEKIQLVLGRASGGHATLTAG